MNDKQKSTSAFRFLMFLFLSGLFAMSAGTSHVYADSDKEDSGDSGGFTIETEQVKGDIDILKILEGKVVIDEGKINGLTITKKLETGQDQEPLIIKITSDSDASIPVTNLKAETNGIPDFGEICGLDPVCLEDVTMTVTEQTAEAISLPNATVKTCFESECDDIPDNNATDEQNIQNKMAEMEETQLSLEEMQEGLEDDKEQLTSIHDLLDQAADIVDKLKDKQDPEDLEASIKDVTELIEEKLDTDDLDEEDADKDWGAFEEKLRSLIDETAQDYDVVKDVFKDFSKTLSKASKKVKQLEKKINQKEESLKALESDRKQQEADEDQELAEKYAALKEQEEKESKEDANADGKANTDDTNVEDKTDIKELKKELKAFKKDMESEYDRLDKLQGTEAALHEQLDVITDDLVDVKITLNVFEKAFAEETFGQLMDHLKNVDLSKEDKEKIKEEKEKLENRLAESDDPDEQSDDDKGNKQDEKENKQDANKEEQDKESSEDSDTDTKQQEIQSQQDESDQPKASHDSS